MGYGRHIADHCDRKPLYLQRTKRGFTTHTRPLYTNFSHPHTLVHGLSERIPPCNLRCKGGALSRAFYTAPPCTCLSDNITARIRDGDNGIIESGLDMNNPRRDIFLLPLGTTFLFFGSCHSISSIVYFFRFPATPLLGPFLVLALVLVLCPRTGNPRLCLKPL